MIKQIILCTLVDIIALFALYMSMSWHKDSKTEYYKSVFYPAFAVTWLLIGRFTSSTVQIVFIVLNMIAYFVIYSLSMKRNVKNTVDTYKKNKEDT